MSVFYELKVSEIVESVYYFFLQKIEVFMIREYREICDLNNIVCT